MKKQLGFFVFMTGLSTACLGVNTYKIDFSFEGKDGRKQFSSLTLQEGHTGLVNFAPYIVKMLPSVGKANDIVNIKIDIEEATDSKVEKLGSQNIYSTLGKSAQMMLGDPQGNRIYELSISPSLFKKE